MKSRSLRPVLVLPFALLPGFAPALDLPKLVQPETLAAHREVLEFSSEQEAKLTVIYESVKAEAAPLEAAVRRAEESLENLLRAPDLDAAATEARFSALLEAEADLKRLQFKTLLGLRAVLSPEQIEKAVALERRDRSQTGPLAATIEAKAERLKAAFDELGLKPRPDLMAKGERIRGLIESGDLAAADRALDELGKEVGIDEPEDDAVIDFGAFPPGDTDLPALEARFKAIETAVQDVTSLPALRQLLQARDALELAKTAQDAESAGRILSWAEQRLDLTAAP